MAIKIFTDSSCDLPAAIIKENKINIVPLHVTFKDSTYFDRVNLAIDEFYKMMEEEEELPKTAAPSPHEYIKLFENHLTDEDQGIIVTLSSQLSSTYQNAKIARDMYIEDNPSAQLEVIDSKNASIGQGIIVHYATKLVEEGITYKELTDKLKQIIDNTHTLIFLDTLENVIKGGRLDRIKGAIASVLSIKILMKNSFEGNLDIIDKVRGSKNAIKRMIEMIEEYGGNIENRILSIAHSNCEEKALKIKEMIEEKYHATKIILTEIGPTIGTYAGKGGILISF